MGYIVLDDNTNYTDAQIQQLIQQAIDEYILEHPLPLVPEKRLLFYNNLGVAVTVKQAAATLAVVNPGGNFVLTASQWGVNPITFVPPEEMTVIHNYIIDKDVPYFYYEGVHDLAISGDTLPVAAIADGDMYYTYIQRPDVDGAVAAAVSAHRYVSIMNKSAVLNQLVVCDSDQNTVIRTVDVVPGCTYLYFADTDGVPTSGNEHYFRLQIGGNPVIVSNTTETHAIANDPVTSFAAPAGFLTGVFADSVGLNSSSCYIVIEDNLPPVVNHYVEISNNSSHDFAINNADGGANLNTLTAGTGIVYSKAQLDAAGVVSGLTLVAADGNSFYVLMQRANADPYLNDSITTNFSFFINQSTHTLADGDIKVQVIDR
ncbi:MAG: hypothetical protein V4577_19495 [Bacteroidota bacterium]